MHLVQVAFFNYLVRHSLRGQGSGRRSSDDMMVITHAGYGVSGVLRHVD
jgi:hypothetical protein